MTTIHAEQALTPEGWRQNVRIAIEGGSIAAVADGTARAGDERAAILVPAMPNLHSHAFQRAMAGLAEIRGPGVDTFWVWRETMYRFALAMTPDDVAAVAAQLHVEMLEAGFGAVGEFHYLHHDHDGRPYGQVGAMAEAIAAAAGETGIGLTLIPVLYAHSTFGGAAPNPGQRRFVSDRDGFARLVEAAGAAVAALPGGVLGVAGHSLRAVTPEELAFAASLRPDAPMHIHAAEQVREVEDCLAWSGRRPVEWLLDNADLSERWCLIHATHMTGEETARLARSGAVAGLCPITEASLGDGFFPAREFRDHDGRFGVGSDSNVLTGVAEELRQLETAQRLARRSRNVMAEPGASTGRAVFDAALSGGAQALGRPVPAIAAGAPADLVSLDADHPALIGRNGDAILDSWIFAASRPAVDGVWVRGRRRVSDGRHHDREAVYGRFRKVAEALAGKL
ncbi:formimidoylglutamate deiminase [Jiella sonneratiae]|uniref:Formimidoylglutamate deiminase n=1 Tax=Jiella sonneratiae TaxID=2816856 RepID=A0ABS3J867_9HYPH|nr:formimidoylglutamate deiminase [Jiella sonneratiae]MBO0905866.1 formimidoylglutamate deiminase [Jiella sonneratiae]